MSSNKGREGEAEAALHLQKQGYVLLEQNFRFHRPRSYGEVEALSELDLIFLAPDDALSEAEAEEARNLLQREAQLVASDELKLPDNVPEFPATAPLLLVFVEVKNWGHVPLSDLSLNLTEARQQRMFRTAQYFLESRPRYARLKRRFDLFAFQAAGEPLHIKAAFP